MPLFPGIYVFGQIKNYNGNCLFNYLKNASKTSPFRAKALHVLLVFFKQFKPSQCAAFWCYCPYLCWDRPTLRNSGQSLPLVVYKNELRPLLICCDKNQSRNLLQSWPDFEGRCGEERTSPEIVLHLP